MKRIKKQDDLIQKAIDLGAKEARMIDPGSVITAAWVRIKCQFGCGGYGSNHCCPPFSPTPEETRRVLDGYAKAILVHCRKETRVTRLIVKLEREIFLSGYYKALGFGAGPCCLCRKCVAECKHPGKTRPSMEACGIDVYATVRANGYPIEVVKDKTCEQNYYGLVLIE